MKSLYSIARGIPFSLCVLYAFFCGFSVLAADDPPVGQSKSESLLESHQDGHPYGEVFSIQGGAFHPNSLSVSNSHATYQYQGSSLNSFVVEPGWGLKLFHFLGAIYLEEGLPFSAFSATIPNSSDHLSLYTLSLDTRLRSAWEWFPLKALIPFVEVGYQVTGYSQSGPSDFESTQGIAGNFVGGAGIDIWINAMFSPGKNTVDRYDSVPVFLTAKWNQIFPSHNGVDMGSSNVVAGLSIGI